LTAIRGYTEALEEPDLQPAQRREFLDIIARQSSRMERLVSDLLKLARLEAGNEAVERSACSLEEILRAVIADHEPAARAKSQRIRWDVDPSVQAIATDAQRLADALRNLLENAIRYSPEGTVTTLSARPDGERAAISVTDQGPGIPASDLTRVFERFYRVDKARSRDSGGTGLGLAIVKHLVETIGGTVEAANHPAGGAVFTIRIPRRG
jgi:two-component system phosphate regulon sensor histidine kinase PhoR